MSDKKLVDLPLQSANKNSEIYAVDTVNGTSTDVRVKLSDLMLDLVRTPVNVSPSSNATNIALRPVLTGSPYTHAYTNTLRKHRQFQVSLATDVNFASPIVDVSVDSDNYTLTTALSVTSNYIWRCRDVDVDNVTSEYSDSTSFTTRAGEVVTPSVVSPVADSVDVSSKSVSSSAFAISGGSDTLSGSYWEFYVNGELVHSSGLVNSVSYNYADMQLLTTYSVRVKHVGTNYGESEWSSLVTFTTASEWPSIIGVVQVSATGGSTSDFQRVDAEFNTVSSYDFNAHPTYSGIVDEIIDGQYMVKIPKFYYKAGTVPNGAYAGKVYWMISGTPSDGFSVHPAFLGAGGVELDQIWIAKYQASSSGDGKLQSIPGVTPTVNTSLTTFRTRAFARNTGGVSGFRVLSYYDLSAVQMLLTIEIKGMDVQTILSNGVISGSSPIAVDQANATWRNMVGLWGNVWQYVDGIMRKGTNGNTWYMWQNNSPQSTNTSDYTTGFINTAASVLIGGYGNWGTINLNMLRSGVFLPQSYQSGSTVSVTDAFFTNVNTENAMQVGGSFQNGSNCGIFSAHVNYGPTFTNVGIGARLAFS